jgi:hypothetical protein
MNFSSPKDASEQALLERMRSLYLQLEDKDRHTLHYQHLTAQILDLAKAYSVLVDARRGIMRPVPKS